MARYTKNIIALFDGDDAGRKAAARSFEIFIEAGLLGRAAFLPKGEDPDTYVRRHGKAALGSVIDGAVPLADYYFSWLEQRHGKTLEGKEPDRLRDEPCVGESDERFRSGSACPPGGRYAGDSRRVVAASAQNRDSKTFSPQLSARSRAPPLPVAIDGAERLLVRLMLRYPSIIQRFSQ